MPAIKEILSMSVFCHVAIYIMCIISDYLLDDHEAGGVESLTVSFTSHSAQFLLKPFIKWDSVYFLQIATAGYINEKQLVFFPFYPTLIRSFSTLLMPICTLNQMECAILSGLLISAICHILSPVLLYKLLLRLNIDGRTARNAALCFVYSPASIFFTTVYTESLFACLSWLGFLLYLSSDQGRSLLAGAPLLLASSTRSNGSLNSVVVVVISAMRLGQLVTESSSGVGGGGVGRRTKKKSRSAHAIRRDMVYEMVKAAVVSVCCWAPYVFFSIAGRMAMCGAQSDERRVGWLMRLLYSEFMANPDALSGYCAEHTVSAASAASAPGQSPYAYLQSKYWNVGFLRFYQWRQTPNILLAVPIIAIALFVIYCAADTVKKAWRSISRTDKRRIGADSPQSPAPASWMQAALLPTDSLPAVVYLCRQIHLPFLLHLVCLLLLALLYAHVQITTRLLCSASPLIYIAMARLLGSRSRRVRRAVVGYLILYNIVGAVLHVNNYPWT